MVSSKKYKTIKFFLLILYMILLLYLVLFSVEFGRVHVARGYNLIPFATINRYIKYRRYFTEINYMTNIYGNIIAFAPLGYFIFTFEKKRKLIHGLLIPLVLSLGIEVAQYILSVGSFDVDDIILNTLGGFLVYCIFFILYKLNLVK